MRDYSCLYFADYPDREKRVAEQLLSTLILPNNVQVYCMALAPESLVCLTHYSGDRLFC